MSKKENIIKLVMVAVLTAAVTWIITYTATVKGVENDIDSMLGSTAAYDKLIEMQDYIDRYFVGEYDKSEAMEAALAGYIEGLGDKWSHYMTAEEYQNYTVDNQSSYTGIGITINYSSEDNAILVLDVSEGSPAELAGMMPMDLITAVNGTAIADSGYEEATKVIRDSEDPNLLLTIYRNGKSFDVNAERTKIDKTYVKYKMLEGKIGYIRIVEFSNGAQDEFFAAVDNLEGEGAVGFVFDVRSNPGGDLSVLLNILNRILDNKVLFIEEYQNGKRHSYDSDATKLDYPMTVLVNEYSYSAAEYFAAVLQEYGVAEVAGTQTTGKGYGQSTFTLSDGSAITISVIRYYTPEGKSLKETGVTPDIDVGLDDTLKPLIGRLEVNDDAQLKAAVESLAE